jgi:hypothetical protein
LSNEIQELINNYKWIKHIYLFFDIYYTIMPNISIQTSDIIELTYSVSNDTTKLNNILDIKRGDI